MSAIAEPKTEAPIEITLPKELRFLLELHRFKVLYGGRGGGKSWAIADALLALGASEQGGLRILCAREVQDSLKSSVHQLLVDRIAKFDLGFFYKITDKEIRGRNGTVFTFTGLGKHTVDSIKSFEGVDVVWVEEAQTVAKRSWDILIPTIRKLNSEIWVSFNPDLVTDEVWIRFIVHPTQHAAPFDCVSRKMNWSDNKHFPEVMEKDRLTCQIVAPLDYDNIWEGMCRTTIAGAIYATEINLMREQQRIRPTPYDPRFQVHTIWDLGWNDMMAIVMVQKISPSVLNIINYREVNFLRYDELVEELKTLKYRWGWDWLPHDAAHANPQTGIGAAKALRKLGRRVRPPMQKTGPEPRIKAARMMFPRIYIDDADRSSSAERGHLGCARLIDCLSHYRRMVPLTTGEPGAPRHDEYSHGADGFGALAEIVDRIMDDEFEEKLPVIEGFQNFDPGMGLLG